MRSVLKYKLAAYRQVHAGDSDELRQLFSELEDRVSSLHTSRETEVNCPTASGGISAAEGSSMNSRADPKAAE